MIARDRQQLNALNAVSGVRGAAPAANLVLLGLLLRRP